ncbi:phage baseplate protein [Lonepinella koalarum]|nr:GPW/gp25 family protein [Lonepinella koalarum]TYG34152.1 phage baseplate protein [Lonepinella koalarum]
MNMLTPIPSTHWQLAPDLADGTVWGIDDVHLCIANILSTPKGTDILRPEFGSNHFDYLDQPYDVALPNMVREITQALQKWETRIVVDEVFIDGQAPHFTLTVKWSLTDAVYPEIYTTQVQG